MFHGGLRSKLGMTFLPPEIFIHFSVKLIFGRCLIFCTSVCNHGALNFAPARRSHASVSDPVMTSQDYIKTEQIRTWLLSSSLAKFQQFETESFFQFCFSLFLPGYLVHVQFLPLRSCGSFVLFSMPRLDFFWSEIFKGLLIERHVFGRTFSFCICF